MSLDAQLPPPPGNQPGQPGQPYYPGAPVPPQQQKTSGLAIAGLIFSILPLIGFILSAIAIGKTGAGKAKGRGIAVTGLILSIVLGIAYSVGGYALGNKVVNSTEADPGCIHGKAALLADGPKVADPAIVTKLIGELDSAAKEAKHAEVRDAMNALKADYVSLQNIVKTGNVPADFKTKLEADANQVDSLCTIGK